MNKNILKLFAILMLCFALVSVLVACGADGKDGADGKSPYMGEDGKLYVWDADKNDFVGYEIKGEPGTPGTPGQNLTCGEGTHKWSEEGVEVVKHGVDAEGNLVQGVTIYMCENEGCGAAAAKFTGHDYEGEGAVVKTEATCLDGAYTTYTCQTDYCQHVSVVKHEDEPALGHTPAVEFNADNIDACWKLSDNQDTTGCPCNVEPVYTTTCTRTDCGAPIDAVGKPAGHHWDVEEGRPSENYEELPLCQWEQPWIRECTVCTCDDEDECGRMEVTKYEEAADHVFDNGKETKAPTCTDKGVKTFTCTLCGTETYTKDIDALGHDVEKHDAKAPTCSGTYWDEYETCKREGCEYTTKQPDHEALPHTYTKANGVVTVVPTPETTGALEFTCTGCNTVVETVELPKLVAENAGEGKLYTLEKKGTNCANMEEVYTLTVDLGEGNEAFTDTFTVDVSSGHDLYVEGVTELRKVDGKNNVYYVYLCEKCETWIVVKHDPKTETPAE